MKKTLTLILALILALSLFAACGKTEEQTTTVPPAADEQTTTTQEAEPAEEEITFPAENSFVDNVINVPGFTLKITDYKVLKVGDKGNEYGSAPVIAFWYDCTNKSETDTISPSSSWITCVTAIQDNDPNTVNKLNVTACPDADLINNQMIDIKPGGTASCAVAYTLSDEVTPVVLKAGTFLDDSSFGSQTFDITK